jgi:hypothetical protein
MQHRLIATALFIAACGPGVTAGSATTVSANGAPQSRIPPGANVDDADDMRCTIEVRTGTRLARPICRSQLEIETDRRYAENLLLHPAEMPTR